MSGAAQSDSVPSPRPHARRDISASAIAAGGRRAGELRRHRRADGAGRPCGWPERRPDRLLDRLAQPSAGRRRRPTACAPACLSSWRSTPGAALLVTALAGVPFNEAVGAFVLAAALTLACGLFGWIDPILRRIPGEIAAAMLAGVLLNFGMGVFTSLGKQPALVLAMCAAYLLCRRWAPLRRAGGDGRGGGRGRRAGPHPDRPAESAPDRIRLDHAGLQRAGRHQPGHSAVRGGDGLAEPAGPGHPAGLRLSSARVARSPPPASWGCWPRPLARTASRWARSAPPSAPAPRRIPIRPSATSPPPPTACRTSR